MKTRRVSDRVPKSRTQTSLISISLTVFQVACAIVFGWSQASHMLTFGTEGVRIPYFVCNGVFTTLNLWLSASALKNAVGADRVPKRESVAIYAMWTGILSIHLGIALASMPVWWTLLDTVTAVVVSIGIIATYAVARAKHLPLLDPYVKAGFAAFFKAVPQVGLAISILLYGKGGLAGLWILMGHVTIATRIVHLLLSNREHWDRNTRGSLISELWNELTWTVATVAWLLK